MIDITMTACIRPDVHKVVFESLKRNLKTSHELRLIMNIDPKGDGTTREEVMAQASLFFETALFHQPAQASFFHAVRTVWNLCQTEFVLQWEDDWELLQPLDLDLCIDYLQSHDKVSLIGFYKGPTPVTGRFSYKGLDLGVRARNRPHFPPALMEKSYVKGMLRRMRKPPAKNDPSPMMRKHPVFLEFINTKQQLVLFGPDKSLMVKDIGREWVAATGIKLKGEEYGAS